MSTMDSVTERVSMVPTQQEARRGVNTIWLRGLIMLRSYCLVSRSLARRAAPQPEPRITTLGRPVLRGSWVVATWSE